MTFTVPQEASSYQYSGSHQKPQDHVLNQDKEHQTQQTVQIQQQQQQQQSQTSLPSHIQRADSIDQDTLSQASSPSSSVYSTITTGDGERSFVCPHCDHIFSRKHNLKSHLLIHSKEKPFNCSICSSKFRRLHDLKRHEKLHTGEKPHQCKNCGRKFARLDALVRHNNSQTGCTLLIDNSVIKGNSGSFSKDRNDLKLVTETRSLLPTILSQSSQIQQHNKQPEPLPQPVLPQQSQQPTQPQQQLQQQPQLSQQKSFESQWRVNQLPSISKLTPLINPQESSLPLVSTPSSSQPVQPSLSHTVSFESLSSENAKQIDLLPYVKLLESRVSLLESKLSTTENKLAQMSYNLQQLQQLQTQSQNNLNTEQSK